MKKYLVGIALYSLLCASLIVTPISKAQTASAPSAPTAGSSTLVLSQVSGGNGTYTHDYVEIKNVSGSTQSLNGLSLYYGSATGNFGAGSFALPNTTIAPGQYYLVQLTQSGTGGAALPVTPDATSAAGAVSMSGSSGKIGLVVASQLATMLTGVVSEHGTGLAAAIPGYHVADKTGTAAKPLPDGGGYSTSKYVASFVGFVPATRPRLVILVTVDEPTTIWGGVVAAPAFQELARFALQYLEVPPDAPVSASG